MNNVDEKPLTFMLLQLFGWLSVISLGGAFGFIPEIQRILVLEKHLLSPEAFQQAFVLGQIVPGPNMALCAAIGYQLAGWNGWLAAFVGIYTAPVLIVSLASRMFQKFREIENVRKFEVALRPLILGLFLGVTIKLSWQTAQKDLISWTILVVLGAVAFTKKSRPLLIVFLGGLIRVIV